MDANETELRERVHILEGVVDTLLDTLDKLLDRETARLNSEQEYVAATSFRDPAVG